MVYINGGPTVWTDESVTLTESDTYPKADSEICSYLCRLGLQVCGFFLGNTDTKTLLDHYYSQIKSL